MEGLNGKNILIVDDEPDFRQLLRMHLEGAGASVFEADNPYAAVALIRDRRIDVLLSDVQMPLTNGFELSQKIRSENNIPIILFSGTSQVPYEDLFDFGVEGFIPKPFTFATLAEHIKKSLLSVKDRWQEKGKYLGAKEIQVEGIVEELLYEEKIDFGRGGMFIRGQFSHLQIGEVVSLRVGSIIGYGLVRWIREESTEILPAGIGVEFSSLQPHSVEKLVNLLAQLKPRAFIPRV